MYKNIVTKSIKEIFDHKRGNSKYTKAYCDKHKGEYEVYTGTTIGTFARINKYDYDYPLLTYTTDGYAGELSVIEGKFSIGGHRAILIPKDKNLNLQYFRYTLQPIFRNAKRDCAIPTINWTLIKDLKVRIPVDKDGNYDYDCQENIANHYKVIEKAKNKLVYDKSILKNSQISLNIENYKYILLKVYEIFDLSISTNSSKFTIGFINENQGDIPVYGAVNTEYYASYGYVKDNIFIEDNKNGKITKTPIRYFENCLTYNIDGEGACGYVFYRTGRFSLSEKVRPLIIFDKYKDKLDPIYLKYVLHPLFLSKVRGRKINKTIIHDLQIPIPIKENGEFDLKAQKEISEKYKKLEAIKEQVINEIDKVLNITVEI